MLLATDNKKIICYLKQVAKTFNRHCDLKKGRYKHLAVQDHSKIQILPKDKDSILKNQTPLIS